MLNNTWCLRRIKLIILKYIGKDGSQVSEEQAHMTVSILVYDLLASKSTDNYTIAERE